MKRISKTRAPHSYLKWCKLVRGTQDEDYRRLQNPEKADLHRKLLEEQGWLCAYTMKSINEENSHIEHIKPESLCRADLVGSDLDYNNMIACFPLIGMNRQFRYGAQKKADWWEKDGIEFISPLNPACENYFHFDLKGNITPVINSEAANTTISVLSLDHPSLTEEREMAINGFIYGSGDKPLSKPKTIQALQTICTKDREGRFYGFCIVVRDALQHHLKILEKIEQKKKFSCRRT